MFFYLALISGADASASATRAGADVMVLLQCCSESSPCATGANAKSAISRSAGNGILSCFTTAVSLFKNFPLYAARVRPLHFVTPPPQRKRELEVSECLFGFSSLLLLLLLLLLFLRGGRFAWDSFLPGGEGGKRRRREREREHFHSRSCPSPLLSQPPPPPPWLARKYPPRRRWKEEEGRALRRRHVTSSLQDGEREREREEGAPAAAKTGDFAA